MDLGGKCPDTKLNNWKKQHIFGQQTRVLTTRTYTHLPYTCHPHLLWLVTAAWPRQEPVVSAKGQEWRPWSRPLTVIRSSGLRFFIGFRGFFLTCWIPMSLWFGFDRFGNVRSRLGELYVVVPIRNPKHPDWVLEQLLALNKHDVQKRTVIIRSPWL